MKTLKIEDINISDNLRLLDKEHCITPFVETLLEKMYFEIPKGKEKTLKKLIKYTNQFPKVPVFKNYLMTYYANKGNEEKVKEVNKWIIKEHPNYLYAKINYAITLLEENKTEEINKILGNSLLLHELLPNRTAFLLDEIISYYGFTIYFLDTIKEIEEADNRLDILKEIDENHPKVKEIENRRITSFFNDINLLGDYGEDEEEDEFDEIAIEKRSHLQTEIPPEFNYKKEINYLYTETTESISNEQLNELLSLDKELLIDDLIKVLYDIIYRYDFFYEGDYDEYQLDFSLHAFNLLLYLKSKKALEVILDIARQDFDFISLWFGDLFFDYLEHAICLLGVQQKDTIIAFTKEAYISSFNRATVVESLLRILDFETQIERKKSVKIVEELINFFIDNLDNTSITNSEFYSLLITDLSEHGIVELLPQIKTIFNAGVVDESFFDSYDKIEKEIKKNKSSDKKISPFETIEAVYQKIKINNNFDFLDEEDDDDDYNFINKNDNQFIETVINSKEKIGRNEPCFCGSGKKYKKCCINK